jgi:transcriptional antiterminator
MDFANTCAEKIEHLLKVHYSQATRIFIYYYFLLLLADIRKNHQITDKFIDEINSFREFSILPFLKKSIEGYVNGQMNSSELQLLALHLHCQAPFNDSGVDHVSVNNNIPNDQSMAPIGFGNDLLKEISLFLNPYLQIDQRFTTELITYLNQNLIYKKHGFSLLNPFHEKTRIQFLDTYETIEKIISNKKYRTRYQLSEDNISTLTMISINGLERIQQIAQKNIRVALISDADSSLIAYTKEQITSNFPWFKIVGIFRQCDTARIGAQKIDLILSTNEIDLGGNYSTIAIDQFMHKIDIDHINSWFGHI